MTAHFARSQILAGATRVFTREGIVAARVEDILVEAQIARRTFYKYFGGKEEVLAALYEIWCGELVAAVEAARAQRPDDPLAGVRAGIDIFLGFYGAAPRAIRDLVELAMRSDSRLAVHRRRFRERIVALMDEAVHALDGRRLDPLLYETLLAGLEGIALDLAPQDVERARQVTHALVDHALALPSPRALPRRKGTGTGSRLPR